MEGVHRQGTDLLEGDCDAEDKGGAWLEDRDAELEETLRNSLPALCSPDSNGVLLDIEPNNGAGKRDECACFDPNDYCKCEGYIDQLRSVCLGLDGDGDDDDATVEEDDKLTPFERIARNMFDLTANGGVLKLILQQGLGDVVPKLAAVRVNYNAYLEYSDEPYDSSHLRKVEVRLWLGKGIVMPGLEVGLLTMRRGELAQFLVRPAYAYGTLGCAPRIPPNATVLLEVELLGFIDCINVDEFYTMTPEERKHLKLEKVLRVALNERTAGNAHFDACRFDRAMHKYLKTLRILDNVHVSSDEEQSQMEASLLKVLLNLALCSLRLNRPTGTLRYAQRALRVQPYSVKAFFRLGQAYVMLGDYEQARYHLLCAQRLAPFYAAITHELKVLEMKWQESKRLEREMYLRMFNTGGAGSGGGGGGKGAGCSATGAHVGVQLTAKAKGVLVSMLKELQHDEGRNEMAFPVPTFTALERAEMMAVARDMGFDAECFAQGTGSLIKIRKKSCSQGAGARV